MCDLFYANRNDLKIKHVECINDSALTINSSAGPWLALANSVSEFIGCLGCRMSRQLRPAKEDSAFLASIF